MIIYMLVFVLASLSVIAIEDLSTSRSRDKSYGNYGSAVMRNNEK